MAQTLIKRSPFSASVISGHTPVKFVICIVERTSFTALWRRAQNKSRCQDTAVAVVVRAVLKLRARIHIMKNAATKISDYVRQYRHTCQSIWDDGVMRAAQGNKGRILIFPYFNPIYFLVFSSFTLFLSFCPFILRSLCYSLF
jgi:hypothetical protein